MGSNNDKISTNIRNAAIKYSEDLLLRSLIFSIPYIGSTLDLIFSSKGQEYVHKRIENTISCLTEEFSKLDKNKMDMNFLNSEEFFDLLMKTIESCIRTRHIEKIRLYSKILAGSISLENSSQGEFVEDIISMLIDLSPKDLKIACILYDQQKNMPKEFDEDQNTELNFVVKTGFHDIPNNLDLNERDFYISLKKLDRAGLVREIVGMYVSYRGERYIISSAFIKLMEFIRYNANSPIFPYN